MFLKNSIDQTLELEVANLPKITKSLQPEPKFINITETKVAQIQHSIRILPSSMQPPKLELKPFPSHLKYAFLAKKKQQLVIIAQNIQPEQENKLLAILKVNKQVIG